MTNRKVITITGPTCSGKTTLAKALAAVGIPEILSFTTRPPRVGEVDGVDYDFLTKEQVDQLDPREVIELVEFQGNYYGNLRVRLEEAWEKGNGVAVVVVEPMGVTHWSNAGLKHGFDVHKVFIRQARSLLIGRLRARLLVDPNMTPLNFIKRQEGIEKVELPTWHLTHFWDRVLEDLGVDPALTLEDAVELILNDVR